jgi:glycine hydroxymethyltransferase
VALKQVADPAFKAYATQVIRNSQAMGARLMEHGYKLQTDGSENHLLLVDLRPLGLTGSKIEELADLCGVTVNKNAVVGDTSALTPGGYRLGTSALTSRSMMEKEMVIVADFLHRMTQIALQIQKEVGKKLVDFKKAANASEDVKTLKKEVEAFATSFALPGIDSNSIKRPAGH